MMLIGQEKIKEALNKYKAENSLPRVISIIGRAGYGKTAVVNYIAELFNIKDLKKVLTIDEIRDIIKYAPELSHNTIVHVSNFESLNFRAKETLLKLCEDVPNYIYVIIEVSNSTLYEDRFLNRSQVLELSPYTSKEIIGILNQIKPEISNEQQALLLSIFGAPKDFELVLNQNFMSIEELKGFIEKVVENVSMATPYNAMKIFDKISTKADDNKLDILLFLHSVSNISFKNYLKSGEPKYLKVFNSVTDTLDTYLMCRRINKKALFDKFIFGLRGN